MVARGIFVPVALALGVSASAVAEEDPGLGVRLECQRRTEPGRVVCEAEIEIERGRLVWVDLLVLEAPPFAPPLRSRVGPSSVVMQTERRQRLRLALAATDRGAGRLRIRARAVHCPVDDQRHCAPISKLASTFVEVGPIREPSPPGPGDAPEAGAE